LGIKKDSKIETAIQKFSIVRWVGLEVDIVLQ
jgi:hypothetical protein